MRTQMLAILTIISVGLISGCGGSNTPTSSISGKVADGYLNKAEVFLDMNNNYQWDAGEPKTTSGPGGAYTIMNVDPADVGKYPIVALAINGVTIDEDYPDASITNSNIFSMPRESVSGTVNSNFISPMSSRLRKMMETGKTMQQAMSDLRTELGLLPETNMLADYMKNPKSPDNPNYQNYKNMHTAAQSMARLMGSQMGQVLSTSGSTTTVDADRYRSMMGTIFSSMTSAEQRMMR